MKAKKHFGQNFLIDQTVLDQISSAVFASNDDLIIEIGPGRGALTERLIKTGATVIAYEIDTDMKPYLNKLESDKFKVIYNDILKTNIKDDIVDIKYSKLFIVGNLPYYITTPIIDFITKQNLNFESFVIMVQKEVADRFLAKPKSKEYGYFTLYLKHYYDGVKITDVKKEAFNPPPKVFSSVVSFTPKEKVNSLDEEKYFEFLKLCFKEKRKTIRNNLREFNYDVVRKVLDKYNYSETVRSEEISEDVFVEIFKALEI